MADGVNIPPAGTGDSTPKVSTQKVTADTSDVQDVSLTSVVGGVRTRNPTLPVSSAAASQVDGHSANIGLLADASNANTLTGLLKAIKAAITGTVAVSGPVTDTQLRATPVPVSGTVTASGPLTDTQLRATPVPVSGTVTASGPLTDTQLRATPVPVSGTVTTTPPSNASTNIAQVAGATIAQGHGVAATAVRVELPTDGTGVVGLAAGAATIGALTANQSVNQTQVAGTAVDTNSGNKSAGTQRVVLATDQVQLTNALKVDGSAVTQPAAEVRAATGAAPTAFTATSSTQVFASNASRKLFTVYNNSNVDLHLMLASAAASVTSYHVKVPANGGYFATSDYSGEIRGILSAAIATGQVTPGEFT